MASHEYLESATEVFHSQDNSLFLQVSMPQCLNGTSADTPRNVATSSTTTVIDQSSTHQTGKESTFQDSINPTGNFVLNPPRHTPSHPVPNVSSHGVTNVQQPSVAFPSYLVYYPPAAMTNLNSSGGINAFPIDFTKVSFINVPTGLNEATGCTPIPAHGWQGVLLKPVSKNPNASDNDVKYLCLTYPTTDAKSEESLKHLNPGSKTGLSNSTDAGPSQSSKRVDKKRRGSNSTDAGPTQSSKRVDKKRRYRYSVDEKNSEYLSKAYPIENLPASDFSSKKSNLDALKNINDAKNETISVRREVQKYQPLKDCNLQSKTVEKQNVVNVYNNVSESAKVNPASEVPKEEGKCKKNNEKSSQAAKRSNKATDKASEEKSKDLETYEKAELAFFDLETGGLYTGVDILQIAAVNKNSSYMQYVTPTRQIDAKAQDINGLKNQNGTLMKRTSRKPLTWEPLETLPIKKSLKEFLNWLDATGPCFLVAHNASFDKRHLLYHVNQSGLYSEFQKRVLGFIDTLPFFRAVYPELMKPGPGHRQEVLVKYVLKESYNAHDALEDVKSLQKLVETVGAPRTDLLKHKSHF